MSCRGQFAPKSGADPRILWVFIDESGDFHFTRSSGLYYVFTALWTYEPLCLDSHITAARYELLANGSSLPRFHASEDGYNIRKQACAVLSSHTCYKVAAIVIRKNRINPSIRAPQAFYPQFLEYLVKFVLKGDAQQRYQRVVIVTDTPPTKNIGKAVLRALRAAVPKYILPQVPLHIIQHPASGHSCLQAADYCSWAISRKWAGRGESEYRFVVLPRLDQQELDVFARGDTDYY